MKGLICLWSGAIVDIPAGWSLCDGGGGRPDLRNRFIVGAGDAYAPDDTGGALTHTHPFTGDGHVHGIPQTAGCPGAGPNACLSQLDTDSEVAAGTTDATDHKPPYFALAFIIKD